MSRTRMCNMVSDGVSVDDVLRERLGALPIPVAAGLPLGHVRDNRPIPFGRRVTLDAEFGSLRVEAT